MRRTIIAAHVLLIAGATAIHAAGPAEPARPAEASAVAACRDAWPYVAAACGGQSAARPVRVLRADAAR